MLIPHMPQQVIATREALILAAPYPARVRRPAANMSLLVASQVFRVDEAFLADAAFVRPLAGIEVLFPVTSATTVRILFGDCCSI